MSRFLAKHKKLLLVLLLAACIAAAAFLLRDISLQQLLAYRPRSPWLAALLLVGIYCAKPVLMFIPTYGLYMAVGIMFSAPVALLVGYTGIAAELAIGYAAGRWLGAARVQALGQKYPKMQKALQFVDKSSASLCFVTRLLPMPYPVDVGSMLFGAAGLPFAVHQLCSMLGLSAMLVPLTLAGGNLSQPLSPQFLVPFGISLAVAGGLFLAYRLLQKRGKLAPKAGGQAAPAQPPADAKPQGEDS